MLYNCSKLISLNLKDFNISSAITIDYMFYSCLKIASFYFGNLNMPSVSSIFCLFNSYRNLTSLD